MEYLEKNLLEQQLNLSPGIEDGEKWWKTGARPSLYQPWGLFLESPETLRPFLGVTISSVSQEGRGLF